MNLCIKTLKKKRKSLSFSRQYREEGEKKENSRNEGKKTEREVKKVIYRERKNDKKRILFMNPIIPYYK